MNILYLHGFGSKFDSSSKKIRELKKIGDVIGYDIDYTLSAHKLINDCIAIVTEADIDCIVGTSMGGWLSAQVGVRCGIPFVSINPAISPSESLGKYAGIEWTDYTGRTINMQEDIPSTYEMFPTKGGYGLILLDSDDEVFSSNLTQDLLENHYMIIKFRGGSHRFDHMKDSIDHILRHINNGSIVYGLDG